MTKRDHDRHSQMLVSKQEKRHGAGAYNWGTIKDDLEAEEVVHPSDPNDPDYEDESENKPQGSDLTFSEIEKEVATRQRPPQHFVIGVDGSAASQHAVQWSLENLVYDGDVVVLLHVSPDYGLLKNVPLLSEVQKLDDSMSAELLREYTADVNAHGAQVKAVVVRGDPAQKIAEYCETNKPNHLVMGTNARTGLAKWLLGSVSDAVLQAASCPVTVVKLPPGYAPPHDIDLASTFGAS